MAVLTFKKVRHASRADADSISLTLFRESNGRVCGWFIGPLQFGSDGMSMPYLPASERTLASVAVVRAIEISEMSQIALCVVDPDDLWVPAWAA